MESSGLPRLRFRQGSVFDFDGFLAELRREAEQEGPEAVAEFDALDIRPRESGREERRQLVIAAKDRPCEDCGNSYPTAVMHLHHRPSETKVGTLSEIVSSRGRQAVLDEIAKCDVLCANCHVLRHIEDGTIGSNDPYGPALSEA